MKRILFGFLFMMAAPVLKGMCLSGFIYVSFPSPGVIAGNSMFVITYDQWSDLDRTLEKGYPVYLYSDLQDTVNLKIETRYTIAWDFRQVVLRPARALMVGHSYRMHIDSLDAYSSEQLNWPETKWSVSVASDTTAPRWLKQPQYLGNSVERLGCGPEKYAYFCYCAEDNFQHAVIVRRKSPGSIVIEECIETPSLGMLLIGHGMCGGPFKYIDSTYCEISFRLIDASGNVSADSSVGIRYPAPDFNDPSAEYTCQCVEVKNNSGSPDVQGTDLMIIAIVTLVAGVCCYVVMID